MRPILAPLLRSLAALGVALLVVALLAAAAGTRPDLAIRALVGGACGSAFALQETILRSVPIALTGLAVAWAFRAGLFNIGAEGQLLAGAMAAAWLGASLVGPACVVLPAVLVAGVAAGALGALFPVLLKVRRGTPEVVTTLLLNFVAENLLRFLANGPLHDPAQQGARTAEIHPAAVLPLLPGGRLHFGVFLAVAVILLAALVLARSRFGLQLKTVGQNAAAGEASGIPVRRVWCWVLLQSGAIAGLAGAVEVAGVHHHYQAGFSPGYGFEGIAVAVLGSSTPLGVLAAALFWGGLSNGAVEMELSTGLSRHMVTAIQAVVVLAIAVRRWPIPNFRRRAPAGTLS